MKKKQRLSRIMGAFLSAISVGILLCGTALGAEDTRADEEGRTERFQYDGPIFCGDSDKFLPEETLERGGKIFRLVSSELREMWAEGRTKYVETIIPYVLEQNETAPETAPVMITDDNTGEQYERLLPLTETEKMDMYWSEDFTFPITVREYQADSYLLGDIEVPKDADFTDYAPEFLAYLGLSEDAYRIEKIVWTGDAYDEDGELCRDARAEGEKLLCNVNAKYSGIVELPPARGKYYRCIYEEVGATGQVPQEGDEEENANATIGRAVADGISGPAEQEKDSLAQKVKTWLVEHITVVRVNLLLILGVVLLAYYELRKGRNSRKEGCS